MKKKFKTNIHNQEVRYELTKRKSSRHIKLSINQSGVVSISMPYALPEVLAHNFIKGKAKWILKKISEIDRQEKLVLPDMSRPEYNKYRLQAHELILAKIEKFNQYYKLSYNRICIKDQKTRWGSCSTNRNLNFNFKILFLPDHLIDYIVVHELCHLEEMNHSSDFWNLVGERVDNYREARRELKEIRII